VLCRNDIITFTLKHI